MPPGSIFARRPVKRAANSLLDATHELTPDGKIRKVHFRKFRFNVRKFLRDTFWGIFRTSPR